MLTNYVFRKIDEEVAINECETAIAYLEYCYKEASLYEMDCIMEDGEEKEELKKEGFFQRIGNAIKKALKAIGDFFKKLFHKNKDVDNKLEEIANDLTKKKGQSVSKETAKQVSPEKYEDIFAFLTIWIMNPKTLPSVLTKESANEMKQLISAFNKLIQLTNGNVSTLFSNGDNVMKSIEDHAKALNNSLKNQSDVLNENKAKPEGVSVNANNKASKFFNKNGVKLNESEQLLKEFCDTLDKLQQTIAEAMSNPEKAKAFESFTNVSSILRESMNAGKVIQSNLNYLVEITPDMKKCIAKDLGLKINNKGAGENGFEIYDKKGNSKYAKEARENAENITKKSGEGAFQGLDDKTSEKYKKTAKQMAIDKYQRDVLDSVNSKN